MALEKRECPIKVYLNPTGGYALGVDIDIDGERHSFLPSSATACGLFDDFLSAVYQLYTEPRDGHNSANTRVFSTPTDCNVITTRITWDEEGTLDVFEFSRIVQGNCFESHDADSVSVSITISFQEDDERTVRYSVNGRDLCYAVAKACTDVLKQFGIHGYAFSTEHGDSFNLDHLLFVKAYALNVPEARRTFLSHGEYVSDFVKEIELLLFEM